MLPGKTALALLLSGAVSSTGVFAAPSVYPTGVTRYDPNKAFNQYVIFSGADKQTHLIDMNGNEVKTWPQAGFQSAIIDPQLVGEVLSVIRDLAHEHDLTMLLVTHEMRFAREVSDRVCFFDKGRICEQGKPDEIFGQPKEDRTREFLASVLR